MASAGSCSSTRRNLCRSPLCEHDLETDVLTSHTELNSWRRFFCCLLRKVKMCASKNEGEDVQRRFVVESTLSNSMKIGGRLRSEVWDHFTPFQDVDGSRKGKCNYCAKNFFADSKKNGTSSLRAHIKTCKRLPSTPQSSLQPIRKDEDEDEIGDEYERFLFRNIKKRQVRIDSYFKKLSEPS